jgi:ER membrane protein complex subunit 1
MYFSLQTVDHRLTGHQINPTIEANSCPTYQIWTASIDPSEDIQAVIRRPPEPVASLGKVLGDRSTLYKYLNPHLTAVLTASRGGTSGCGVYLIDGVRGNVLYHSKLPATSGACDVHAALTENWLVYHYYDSDSSGNDTVKGFRMVSVELYEGTGINEKTQRYYSSKLDFKAWIDLQVLVPI